MRGSFPRTRPGLPDPGPRPLAPRAPGLLPPPPLVSHVTHTGITPDLRSCPTSPPRSAPIQPVPVKLIFSLPNCFRPGFLSRLMAPLCSHPARPPLLPAPALPVGFGGSPSHPHPWGPPALPSSEARHLSAGPLPWPPHGRSPVLRPPAVCPSLGCQSCLPNVGLAASRHLPIAQSSPPQQERGCQQTLGAKQPMVKPWSPADLESSVRDSGVPWASRASRERCAVCGVSLAHCPTRLSPPPFTLRVRRATGAGQSTRPKALACRA